MNKNNLIKLISAISIVVLFTACSNDSENKTETASNETDTASLVKKEVEVAKEVVKEKVEVAKEVVTEKVQEVKQIVTTTKREEVQLGACKGCHGANFEKVALGKSKIVSEMTKDQVSEALIGYKNDTYGGAMKGIMKAQVVKYSDEALRNTGLGK